MIGLLWQKFLLLKIFQVERKSYVEAAAQQLEKLAEKWRENIRKLSDPWQRNLEKNHYLFWISCPYSKINLHHQYHPRVSPSNKKSN